MAEFILFNIFELVLGNFICFNFFPYFLEDIVLFGIIFQLLARFFWFILQTIPVDISQDIVAGGL